MLKYFVFNEIFCRTTIPEHLRGAVSNYGIIEVQKAKACC